MKGKWKPGRKQRTQKTFDSVRKLTDKQVQEIRAAELRGSGKFHDEPKGKTTLYALSLKYNVSYQCIVQVIARKTYRHLK